jgi:hypothetical protein
VLERELQEAALMERREKRERKRQRGRSETATVENRKLLHMREKGRSNDEENDTLGTETNVGVYTVTKNGRDDEERRKNTGGKRGQQRQKGE